MRYERLLAGATLALLATAAQAQTVHQQVSATKGAIEAAQLMTAEATIQSIDQTTREIVLKNKAGETTTVVAGPDVKRLADLKVGDEVTLDYYESLTLSLDQVSGGSAAATTATAETRAEPTELPGGIKTTTTTLTAKVVAIDTAASEVTVTGPKGRSVVLEVDPEVAAKLKVGDLVNATYTQAVAVSVSRAK
jgi:hypothetical protein